MFIFYMCVLMYLQPHHTNPHTTPLHQHSKPLSTQHTPHAHSTPFIHTAQAPCTQHNLHFHSTHPSTEQTLLRTTTPNLKSYHPISPPPLHQTTTPHHFPFSHHHTSSPHQEILDSHFDAGRQASAGIIGTTIVSYWSWAASFLQSTTVTALVCIIIVVSMRKFFAVVIMVIMCCGSFIGLVECCKTIFSVSKDSKYVSALRCFEKLKM